MKIEGDGERNVRIDGQPLSPARPQQVWNHSPDGFNWGYGGSGPAQLALAILLAAGCRRIARSVCTRTSSGRSSHRCPRGEAFVLEVDVAGWIASIEAADTQHVAILYPAIDHPRVVSPGNGQVFTLLELQTFVGGYIEAVYPSGGGVLFINEDGKHLGLPVNALATLLVPGLVPGDRIVGDAVHCSWREAGEDRRPADSVGGEPDRKT